MMGEGREEDCLLAYPPNRSWMFEEAGITFATLLKIVLMLVPTPGMIAQAAPATKPAINAYSIRSCPRVSFQTFSFKTRFVSRVMFFLSLATESSIAIGKLSPEDGT